MTNDELDALEKRLQQHSADDANTPDASIVMDEAQHALASLRRRLTNQRSRYDEIIAQADKRAASLQSSVATLNAQLTAERERAERMCEEEVTASICFDKVVKDRDAALAEVKALEQENITLREKLSLTN